MSSAAHELAVLAATLVAPLGPLPTDDEVIVCPPAELIGIPWGVLDGIASQPVRVVPSATLWWRTKDRRPSSDRVLLVAGPDVPAAIDEVRQVARNYDCPQRVTGSDAVCERIEREASGAALVHLACHGRLRTDSPAFSSLRLVDGPLTVHDLEQLDEAAHHWILAACDLASPGRLAGADLEGVVAALLHQGAGGVIAASVSVPDVDTRELMIELHRCLASGESMPEALRRARKAVDVTAPAGFVTGTAFTCYGGG